MIHMSSKRFETQGFQKMRARQDDGEDTTTHTAETSTSIDTTIRESTDSTGAHSHAPYHRFTFWIFTLVLCSFFAVAQLAVFINHDTTTSCGSYNWTTWFSFNCLSPRRVIYGLNNTDNPQALSKYMKETILSLLITPMLFPNLISLMVCLFILHRIMFRSSDGLFHLIKQLYTIQWGVFVMRSLVSFVTFRGFGWTESLLWAFDARHFVSCNRGVTSFVMFKLVQSFANILPRTLPMQEEEAASSSDEEQRKRQRTENWMGLKQVMLVMVGCFVLHFTSHLPFELDWLWSSWQQGNQSLYSLFMLRSIRNYSDYLLDHTFACVLGFLSH